MSGSAPPGSAPTLVKPPPPIVPATPASASPGAAAPAGTLADIAGRWGELGQHLLRAGAPLLAAALGEATPVAATSEQLTVEAPAGRMAVLTDPEQQRVVGNACLALFGARLRLVVRPRAGKLGAQPAVTDERQRRYQAAQEHPVVRELMQRFEADLVGRELVDLQTWLGRLAAEREAGPRKRFQGDLPDLGNRADG